MMTQADVFESLKNDDQLKPSSAAYVNHAREQNTSAVTLNTPDLVPTADNYRYDQDENHRINTNPPAPTENTSIKPLKYFANDSAINSSKGLRNIIIGGLVFSALVTVALIIQIAIGTTQVPYRIGIVTQEKVCSDIGSEMVRQGGKSIDAFIASSLCLSVVNPFSAGPGAGGFLLIRDHKHDKNLAFNCFLKSGENVNRDDYKANPVIGVESIGIPGEFKCLQEVYKYARFNWKKLTKPAIKLAEDGFRVSKNLADHLKQLDVETVKTSIMSEIFLNKDGDIVKQNDIIKNKRLAETIRMLRDDDNELYEGQMANSIVSQLESGSKSQLTNKDFRNYELKIESETTETRYNDFVLITAPFPSNGPILKLIFEMMKSLSLKVEDFKTTKFYNQLLKATQVGYKMSSYVADPVDTVLPTLYNQKLKESIKYFESIIDEKAKDLENPLADIRLDDYELTDDLVTNFISVNDHNDLMISYTGTLGSAWGSRVMTKQGFILNNALNFFTYGSQNPNELNDLQKNKQPRALFTPILTYNNKNPCVRRFAISYGHHGFQTNDYGLTELTEVILKLFTDYSLYNTAISDKRIQYHFEEQSCFEDGFNDKIKSEITGKKVFTEQNNCSFHGIDLVMKKDHIIYTQVDTNRSLDQAVLFNN